MAGVTLNARPHAILSNVCISNTRQGTTCSRPASAKAASGKVTLKAGELRSLSSAFSGCSISSARNATIARRSTMTVVSGNTLEAGVGLFGHKAGMTQIFKEDGTAVGVTVIAVQAGNIVSQVKTEDTDGYDAIQVAYYASKEKHINKPEQGHLDKNGIPYMRKLSEFRLKDVSEFEVGQQLNLDIFKEGDLVDIQGTSIGKGFQGGIKRWGFTRGPMSHGSKSHREHGSMGAGTNPGRVIPGVKQAGQMGNKTIKIRKLEVVRVDEESSCILVKGSVPGKPGGILRITPAKCVGKNV